MLFDVVNAKIENLVIHKIGSSNLGTANIYSDNCLKFSEDSMLPVLLKQYFLATFHEPNLYHLDSPSGPNENLVFQACSSIFENTDSFYEYSKVLADLLYKNSLHPNIKEGEFYLTLFNDVRIFDENVRCIGIFKSETKETFLTIQPDGGLIGINYEQGINIKKLDKGCLIFEIEKEKGYVVSMVDKVSKNNEAAFWKNDFLGLQIREDNNYDTQNYMNVCREFVEQVYSPANDVPRENQIDMQSRTIDYFKSNETFNEDQFKETILENDDIVKAFDEYKQNYQEEKGVNLNNDFIISNDVVKSENKRFKSVLKLDKNFHVYVHGSHALMEKGYDDNKKLNYYKLYFDNES